MTSARACRARNSDSIDRRRCASRFASGSSSSRIAGRAARLRASATRCRWPPESWCGLAVGECGEVHHRQRLRDPRFPLGPPEAERPQPVADVARDAHVGPERIGLEHIRGGGPAAARSGSRRPRRVRPSRSDPRRGAPNPARSRSRVVLPQPEGPSSATKLRAGTAIVTPSTARVAS